MGTVSMRMSNRESLGIYPYLSGICRYRHRVDRAFELILRIESPPELRMTRLSNAAQHYGGQQARPQVVRPRTGRLERQILPPIRKRILSRLVVLRAEMLALAQEQLATATATATAETHRLRASVVRKRVRGENPCPANAALR